VTVRYFGRIGCTESAGNNLFLLGLFLDGCLDDLLQFMLVIDVRCLVNEDCDFYTARLILNVHIGNPDKTKIMSEKGQIPILRRSHNQAA
jgi:hypothetical protein